MALYWKELRQNVLVIILILLFIDSSAAGPLNATEGGHMYDVIFTAASMDSMNPVYLGPGAYMRVSRKGRGSVPTMSAFFPFVKQLPVNVNISYHSYQKLSNKWHESFIKGSMSLCTILETKIKSARILFNFSNFPEKCPVLKGNYSINEFKFDTKDLPPFIPGNEWRLRIGWMLDRPLLIFNMDVKIDRTREIHAKRKPNKN